MKPSLSTTVAVFWALGMAHCEKPEGVSSSVDEPSGVPVVSEAKPQDGTFILYGGYTNITLELDDDRFRYWFESDVKGPHEPDYPLEGSYTITNNRIHLDHPEIGALYREWRFRSINGVVTLWSKDTSDFKPVSHELIDGGRPQYFLQTFEVFLERGTGAHVSGAILVPKRTE